MTNEVGQHAHAQRPEVALQGSCAVTRLAPSPTGTLHVGNVFAFLITWAVARQRGWKVILRIEDLDRTRVRPGAAEHIIESLEWLGINWDEGPTFQSSDLEPYRQAMRTLCFACQAYASRLTRRQVESAASAPHGQESESRFPPEMRPSAADSEAWRFEREDVNYRFVVPDMRITVADELAGPTEHDPCSECGDFIIWTKLGVPAYQLAVVVDDARHGVTDVVRGDDLLPSAARQTLLYRALGLALPTWWHFPLVVSEDGRRLAKRDGDAHLQLLRRSGVPAERLIGLLAAWCGIGERESPQPLNAAAFLARFDLDLLPRAPVRFTRNDHAWLTRAAGKNDGDCDEPRSHGPMESSPRL